MANSVPKIVLTELQLAEAKTALSAILKQVPNRLLPSLVEPTNLLEGLLNCPNELPRRVDKRGKHWELKRAEAAVVELQREAQDIIELVHADMRMTSEADIFPLDDLAQLLKKTPRGLRAALTLHGQQLKELRVQVRDIRSEGGITHLGLTWYEQNPTPEQVKQARLAFADWAQGLQHPKGRRY
jgi:hypothetical protein